MRFTSCLDVWVGVIGFANEEFGFAPRAGRI